MENWKINNVIDEFKLLVKNKGNDTAIETADRKISFQELNELSDIMMDQILMRTVGERTRVVLYLSHSYQIIVSILAVLKSGNVYVPVSLKANEGRKKYIAECCDAKLAITDQEYPYIPNVIQVADLKKIAWTEQGRSYAKYEEDDETYMLFTSGSTGEPKGCAITYGNLLYILNNMQEICPTDETSAYCFSTPYTFDVSTTEIYGWIGGGKVVVCDTTQYTSYRDFCMLVEKHKMTHLAISPSGLANMFKMYNESDIAILANQLQYVMVAGEEFKKTIYDKWNAEKWNFRLFNLYGPTEATVYALYYELQHDMNYEKGIPLGGPLAGCEYIIENVDQDGIGELVLLGDGICSGYINNETEMKKRFGTILNAKNYRTGDMVSFENGTLLYHGRNDDQIQINGIRVELGEIEATMMELDEIVDVCVASNGKILISYVCLQDASKMDVVQLKEKLGTIMPRYMIPNYINIVDAIPLNENRKSDRKRILAEYMECQKQEKKKRTNNSEANEMIILKHMKAILLDKVGMGDIDVEDDFFEYGGDSLAAFTLVSYLEEEFHVVLDVNVVYLNKNARNLGKYISQMKSENVETCEDEEDNLLHMSRLNEAVNQYMFDTSDTMIRSYKTMYLQNSYYHNKVGGILAFDYNVGSFYSVNQIKSALVTLMKENSVLRTKLKKTEDGLYFQEFETVEKEEIPYVELGCASIEKYIRYLKDIYVTQIYNARYHEGYLALFIVAKINKNYFVLTFADHCIADAGCESIIKRKIGDLLNGIESTKTRTYHEYVELLRERNTMNKLQENSYMQDLQKYVVPNRDEVLAGMTDQTCKIEISNVNLKTALDYTLFVSYVTSNMIAQKIKRDIATGIVLNNRDYVKYTLSESLGDLHTNMIIFYNRGMNFADYKKNAQEIIQLFGEDYFQPYQAIEDNYPIFTPLQQEYMDTIIGTRILKVNFLGQYTMNEIQEKEKYMNEMQHNLHEMLNAVYATAYACHDKIFIYLSKDIFEGQKHIACEFEELVV